MPTGPIDYATAYLVAVVFIFAFGAGYWFNDRSARPSIDLEKRTRIDRNDDQTWIRSELLAIQTQLAAILLRTNGHDSR